MCSAIDAAAKKTDILGQIFEGVVSYMRPRSCYDMNEFTRPTETNLGWRWQVIQVHFFNDSSILFLY